MSGIFSINTPNPAMDAIKKNIADLRWANKQINVEHRGLMDDFYHGRQYKPDYLKNYGFADANIPLMFINLTRKIINKVSLVYKSQPDRKLYRGDIEIEDNKYNEFLSEQYKFAPEQKRAERLKNLYHSILFRPMVGYDKKTWNYFIDTEWIPYFDGVNSLTPVAYSIPILQDITKESNIDVQEYMFWSKEQYFWHQIDGDKITNPRPDPFREDGKMDNPLGLLPFIEMREESAVNEYWPDGALDLVYSNRAINVALNDLNYIMHFQAFNQPYGRGISKEMGKDIKVGANKFIALSDPEMDLGLLNYSPQISQAIEAITHQIMSISTMYNCNIDWSVEGAPASGFSLLVRNIDLMEAREDDVDYAKGYEREIYKIIQRQDEVYGLGLKLPKLGDIKLVVDFHEIDFPVNQKEEQERWDWEIKNDIKTPIDYIQSDQGLSEDEAKQRYADNKALNQKLSLREQMLRDELKGAIVGPETDSPE